VPVLVVSSTTGAGVVVLGTEGRLVSSPREVVAGGEVAGEVASAAVVVVVATGASVVASGAAVEGTGADVVSGAAVTGAAVVVTGAAVVVTASVTGAAVVVTGAAVAVVLAAGELAGPCEETMAHTGKAVGIGERVDDTVKKREKK
jgi:hypothetical protein